MGWTLGGLVKHNDLIVSPVDTVEKDDTIPEHDVHTVLFVVVTLISLLEDVDVHDFLKVFVVDGVGSDWLLGLLLWQEVPISVHKAVDKDLISLEYDGTNHAIW